MRVAIPFKSGSERAISAHHPKASIGTFQTLLVAMSGPRNPYQEGPLGVIKPGTYADMLLIDGNPLEDMSLTENPDEKFLVIMKDGKIYKNMLDR